VNEHNLAVGGEPNIALNGVCTLVNRALNSGWRVLGKITGSTSMTDDPRHDDIVPAATRNPQRCPRRVRAEAQ
jgi:hypothetical protein